MALTATMFDVEVELSDVDRAVYETLSFKIAQHPSESVEYMLTRILAYCLEYTEGIAFTQGVSAGDEPAVVVRDLTGAIQAWIEVGMPDADRLHRARKASPRVAVYTHRDIRQLLGQLEGKTIHRRETIDIYPFERQFINDVAAMLERRTKMSLSVTERHLYLDVGGRSFTTVVEPVTP